MILHVSDSGTGSGTGSGSGLPSSLAAAIALLVAALAAIGLTGDALVRAVRNEPQWLAASLGVALLGGGIYAFAQLLASRSAAPGTTTPSTTATDTTTSTTKTDTDTGTIEKSHTTTSKTETSPVRPKPRGYQWIGVAGLMILLFGVVWAIVLGTTTIRDRERPLVSLQSGPVVAAPSAAPDAFAEGSIEITVTVRAVGMTTSNDVAVQVLGLYQLTEVDEGVVDMCEQNHTWNSYQQYVPLDGTKAVMLLWNRIGPKSDGSVEASWKMQIPAGKYAGLCAWSAFGGELREKFQKKTSAAYLQLSLGGS
jgi:hypothetical protein